MAFFFDRAPDKNNLEYGHPYKRDVPAYRVSAYLAGRGAVGGVGVPRTSGAKAAWRYLRSSNVAKSRDRHVKRISIATVRKRTTAPGALSVLRTLV